VLGLAAATAVGFALGLEAALARRARMVVLVLGLAAAVSLPLELASIVGRSERFATDARVITKLNVEVGEWLADQTPADAIVAVNDAGAIRYFGHRTTIDLLGLNSSDVAFQRVAPATLVASIDYAAVYPVMVRRFPWLRPFPVVAEFAVPHGSNTIEGGGAAGHERVVIGKRP
jgi:hypothetical protein